jgi:hypothetical protein
MNKIYLIYDSSGKHNGYVGKTLGTIESRLAGHIDKAKRNSKYHCHRALRKLKYAVQITLLEEIPDGISWEAAEQKWIKRYKEDLGWNLWNMTDGGEGTSGFKWEEDSKNKQSKIRTDFFKGHPERREHLSKTTSAWLKTHDNPFKGHHHTKAAIENNRQKHLGKISYMPTEETIKKISDKKKERDRLRGGTRLGATNSVEHNEKLRVANLGEKNPMYGATWSIQARMRHEDSIDRRKQREACQRESYDVFAFV